MGLFFENVHLRRNEEYQMPVLKDELIKKMTEKGYEFVPNGEQGDCHVIICEPKESKWTTIASDIFNFNSLENINDIARPLLSLFHTDVIVAGCYDSDYLMLDLVSDDEKKNGWINIGHAEWKILKRTSIAAWKRIVTDENLLKEILKQEHVFAEDAFLEIGKLIGMVPSQTFLNTDDINTYEDESVVKLTFIAPKEEIELPKFMIYLYNGLPCKIDEPCFVSVLNKGGKSKGIGVMFVGDYVENDEITFSDVTLEWDFSKGRKSIPIELKKVKLTSGMMAYSGIIPDFMIPPAVSEGLTVSQRQKLEFDRGFGVRFTPRGNAKKVLDILVVIYPFSNPQEGQTSWKYLG